MKTHNLNFTVKFEDRNTQSKIIHLLWLGEKEPRFVPYKYNQSKKYFDCKLKLTLNERRRYINSFLELHSQGGTGWTFEVFDSKEKSLKKVEGKIGDKDILNETKEAKEILNPNVTRRFIPIDLKKNKK